MLRASLDHPALTGNSRPQGHRANLRFGSPKSCRQHNESLGSCSDRIHPASRAVSLGNFIRRQVRRPSCRLPRRNYPGKASLRRKLNGPSRSSACRFRLTKADVASTAPLLLSNYHQEPARSTKSPWAELLVLIRFTRASAPRSC